MSLWTQLCHVAYIQSNYICTSDCSLIRICTQYRIDEIQQKNKLILHSLAKLY